MTDFKVTYRIRQKTGDTLVWFTAKKRRFQTTSDLWCYGVITYIDDRVPVSGPDGHTIEKKFQLCSASIEGVQGLL